MLQKPARALLWTCFFVTTTTAQNPTVFNMFPVVDSTKLAQSLGWSRSCLAAMNTTLDCDADLFRMTGQIDQYRWSVENLTTLCVRQCQDNSSAWIIAVESACAGQTYSVGGRLVPVDSVAGRYNEGVVIACSQPSDLRLHYTSNPDTLDASSVDGDLGNPNSTTPLDPVSGNPIFDPHDIAPSTNGTDDPSGGWDDEETASFEARDWCYIESQNWSGVDPSPNCTADPSNIFCTDPDSMNRLAHLYYDDILCDPCFLTIMWYRVNSLFLPDTHDSDWLIQQYQDIQDICQISMPETVVRSLPNYPVVPNATVTPPPNDPVGNLTTPGSTSCAGQVLTPGTLGCDALSEQYGVTTGDLLAATATEDCSSSLSICLPNACTLRQVTGNASCDGLAASYNNATLNVTTTLFLRWNPNILGLCDSLTTGQYVCSSPPGGAFTLPPPIDGINASASSQSRGGHGGDSNPNGPDGPGGPTLNSTAAAPTQSGIASDCNKFAYASSGDTCYGLTQTFKITLSQLVTWNPALGALDGSNCTTQFWVGYDYCVGTISDSATSSSSTSNSPPTSTTTLPYPTQAGIDPKCSKYKNAVSGDYCTKFADDNGITAALLYALNPILGSNGVDCSANFQAGYDYCIGISTPTTSSSPLPYPTQSGIASNCNKFAEAVSEDYCYEFAQKNGITTAQLYQWNTMLGSNGEDCSAQFQAGYDYCVGVSP